LADPLGVDVMTAAAGMIRVVNESMVDAIGVVSVQRGIDPTSFVLVAGGGAGALHAGRLAAALGMKRVLIPAEAGTLSAYGMTSADVRHDHTRPLYMRSDEARVDEALALVEDMEKGAHEALEAEGFDPAQIATERLVDARYHGQVHELITPIPAGALEGEDFDAIVARFHELHAERYGWMRADYPVEFLHWRVAARGSFGRSPEPRFAAAGDRVPAPAAKRARDAYFHESDGYVETPVYLPDEIPEGSFLRGPAIIDGSTTTIVVFPDQLLVAGPEGSFMIEIEAESGRA
jgi:N-methylhydantoinase A